MSEEINTYYEIYQQCLLERKELKARLAKAIEVIEFYGNSINWSNSNGASYYEDFLLIKNDRESFDRESIGGKRAREFLANTKENEK